MKKVDFYMILIQKFIQFDLDSLDQWSSWSNWTGKSFLFH